MKAKRAREYARAYEEMIRFLLSEFDGTPLILILTTHVADSERDLRVKARNNAVLALAKKYGLPVIDFYKPTNENPHLLSSDGVHLSREGYELLANELVECVRETINLI